MGADSIPSARMVYRGTHSESQEAQRRLHRILREIREDTPVIVSSGYSEQEAMDRFPEPRPAGFLQKPYRLGQLVEALERVRNS